MEQLNRLSLNSLLVLATVAQHKHHAAAAKELHVSQSAISHQLKRLEERLGTPLTRKEGKYVLLTPDAEKLALSLQHQFAAMEESLADFMGKTKQTLQVGVENALAVNCLTPAMGMVQDEFPDLDIRIRMLHCEDEADRLGLDIILGTKVSNSAYISTLLRQEIYVAVESPSAKPTATLLDLSGVNSWDVWETSGLEKPNGKKYQYFSHTVLLLQAALNGQGTAILERFLIQEQLNRGDLVQVNDHTFTPSDTGYYLSISKTRQNDKKISAFTCWITDLIGE